MTGSGASQVVVALGAAWHEHARVMKVEASAAGLITIIISDESTLALPRWVGERTRCDLASVDACGLVVFPA